MPRGPPPPQALTQRATGLADSLHQRTLQLDGTAEPTRDDEDLDEDGQGRRASRASGTASDRDF
ncbi:hypothetical protein ACIQ7D_25215 [Streptomyces sp. NPDC096310]|uniref:hypothetical protein n=1 Tax=Streptomyces sp. NPDC096310 TaxID=3366082 RepID=UPI0037F88DBC